MSERQFNHLANSRHLLSAATDVVIANVVELFLIFAINWLTFGVEHSIGGNNTKLLGFSGNNFELHWLEITSDDKQISFLDWSVSILEIGYEVRFCEISSNALDCVSKREDMNFSEIWYFSSSSYLHNISKAHSEIFSHCLVHADFSVVKLIVNESNNQSLFSLLSFDENSVAFENFEFSHFSLAELNGRILIVEGFLYLDYFICTSSLFGAFFWSRIAVDTSFFGGSIVNQYKF